MLYLPEPCREVQVWRPERNNIYDMDALQLLAHLPDASVDMLLCDLPYGMTQNKWDVIIPLDQWWNAVKRVMKPRGAVVLTAIQPFTSQLVTSAPAWYQYEWVWQKARKSNFLNVKRMPLRQHEDVLVFGSAKPHYYPVMTPSKGHDSGGTGSLSSNYGQFATLEYIRKSYYPSSILHVPHDPEINITLTHQPDRRMRHPTQKPVALFAYLIKTYTQPGDLVIDPCVGSGTTAVAAIQTGRDYICGDNGTSARTGRRWADLARERVKNSDPYQPTKAANGQTQHSLFEILERSDDGFSAILTVNAGSDVG